MGLLLMISSVCVAQEVDSLSITPSDTLIYTPEVVVEKERKNIFKKVTNVMDHVTNFFMGCDTTYITPQLYEFTAQLELSNWNDFYHMRAYGASKSMDIMSEASTILGGYLYWSIFGYGYSFNLRDVGVKNGEHNGTGRRQTFVLNTGRIFAEYYTFNSGKTARITRITGQNLSGLNTRFRGLQSWCTGLNFSYIFNHNKYSWPAAFGENAVQRKSSGRKAGTQICTGSRKRSGKSGKTGRSTEAADECGAEEQCRCAAAGNAAEKEKDHYHYRRKRRRRPEKPAAEP